MIRIDVIRLAGDAGLTAQQVQALMGPLERLVDLAQAAEREACAQICDTTPPQPFRPSIEAAHAIRARSAQAKGADK